MNRFLFYFVGLWLVGSAAAAIDGAELRLKSQARTSTGIVRLTDIAEVFAADAAQLERFGGIELGPAPSTGTKRYIRLREVQDALYMRGVSPAETRLSGASVVEVSGPGEPAASKASVKPMPIVDDAMRERAEKLVAEAVVRCLQKQAGVREPWEVRASLDDEQVIALTTGNRRLTVEGGTHPWVGLQRFSARLDGRNGVVTEEPVRFEIEVEVALPPAVVAVARDVKAGTMLHPGDLVLKPVKALPPGVQPFYAIEEVVGHETTWGMPAGTVLGRTSVRRPIVVRRGDAVTLYARAAGLQVRTTVRAREDGSIGSLITVESLATREPFYARVTGIQEAEVFAAPAEAAVGVSATRGAGAFTAGGSRR